RPRSALRGQCSMKLYALATLVLLALSSRSAAPLSGGRADSARHPREAYDSFAEGLARRAAMIRPTAAESIWQTIPWLTSAAEAQRQAQREKRPIFVWMLDEDPLERC